MLEQFNKNSLIIYHYRPTVVPACALPVNLSLLQGLGKHTAKACKLVYISGFEK